MSLAERMRPELAESPPAPRADVRAASPWAWLVLASALVLLLAALGLAGWWILTSERRTTTYRVVGELAGIELDVGAARVVVDGGAAASVEVRREERFAFGHDVRERRSVRGGVLRLHARCPRTVLGDCAMAYRLAVPDNVPVAVRTTSGAVRVEGLRGSARLTTDTGSVRVDEFCGFALRAVSETGDVLASAECSPERLELRSGTGDVTARVPPGAYETDAQSDSGRRRVRGITERDGSPFRLQALSTTGDVLVEAGR